MSGETRYIGWSSGDSTYVCDGTADNIQINQALAWAAANPGNTVYLRGPYTYDIQETLRIGSSTVFTGDSTAVLRLNDSCAWYSMVPVIGQYGGTGTVTTGVEIYGFEIDCNESTLYGVGGRIHGKGYYNAIYIVGQSTSHASDIHVHNMKIHDSLGDGVRVSYGINIRVHDCDLWNLEHCSVFCIDSTEINVYGNEIQTITCSGVRLDNCQDWSVNNNTIVDWTGTSNAPKLGAHGVQFGNEPASYNHTTLTKNGKIYDNTIDVGACGIQIEDYLKTAGTTAQNVEIRNNIISGGSTNWASYFAGISIYSWGNGLTISKNTITGSARAGIFISGAITTGVSATVSSNNIINTVKAGADGGYGIWNKVPTKFTIIASGNYSTNNIAGNYKNVTPSSESSSYIDDAIPGGAPDVDDPDTPDTPDYPDNSIYVPATSNIIDDDDYITVTRDEDDLSAYINNVPLNIQKYSCSGGKVIGESKSPSVAGSNLADLNFEGSNLTLGCLAFDMDELHNVMASFYKIGRCVLELGGPHTGYFVTGTGSAHRPSFDVAQGDIPEGAYDFTVDFKCEDPYKKKIEKRVRGRYIYNSMQFSSDDIY
ncbi:MAG: right-handed parallel beta-helix repeat-containing protein, partial [Parabacteroides sp.]